MELRSGRRLRSSSQRQQLGSPGGGSGEDCIGALPDDLLLLILAHLRCVATAVRTSVLSRRWTGGLWTRLREIVFRDIPFPSLEAALGCVDSPAVSLLDIRVPHQCMPNHVPDSGGVQSLLRTARAGEDRLLPLVLKWPFHRSRPVLLPPHYLHRASLTSPLSPLAGGRRDAVSVGQCVPDLDLLLSCCPRLRTLWLGSVVDDRGHLRIRSALLQKLVVGRTNQLTSRVNIVAPVLKQLTMSFISSGVSISVFAPMVEEVYWHCTYGIAFGLWRLHYVALQTAEFPSLKICASASSHALRGEENTFAQEIEKHMIAKFSVLELHLMTNGHVFGGLMIHLLGMIRIPGILDRSTVQEECPFDCPCETSNWRSQTISLSALEEVEINGVEGCDHEIDFLKLIFKCAPILKKMTVKMSQEASTSNGGCAKIYNIFEAYSSVECNVDHNSG